ncbi:CRISPR-associated protein Cas4 [Pseudodesulfovibrio thermohalotolerans]|uniref:CRISPR-associated protein Cas4 n=1 Tax=Pseudodesulfovibrio thermohalotolerans TaxID=2880651 RepID=UPI0022BA08C1|nr:CRISPR-associated protein Cas4 [Pseudodesulfovibrio thermohalotolerans]WFS63348.1 CRISPR-associated protein Cas4 [Pseudodesulfovibrio thermohalotolerans]
MDRTLPLSALQHYLYCPRQCALIHVEKVWEENRFTAEGRLLHLRADAGNPGRRGGVIQDRAVPLRSDRLGLYGVADVVEMRPGSDGREVPFPVEYKRGSPKVEDWDRAQLCAQAMCLEEMLGVAVPEGAIFYGKPRRRERVVFDARLREAVEGYCRDLHAMVERAETPEAVAGKRCRNCSLKSTCMPSASRRVENYLLKGLDP